MGLYSQVIFPRLCDLFLNSPHVARHRRELLAHAHGNVLEIGFGTGLNLPHYPAQVRKLTTVDPNAGMHRLAQRRIRESGIDVDQRVLSGERRSLRQRHASIPSSARLRCATSPVSAKPWGKCTGYSSRVVNFCFWSTASAWTRTSRSGSGV